MALRVRRERRKRPGSFRLHKPQWSDPFPTIPGTEPEKRIFAELVRRRIYFRYQADAPKEVVTANNMVRIAYVPDFALPEYKCIIDPFSPFHHTLKEAVERDSLKVARFTSAGWEYYHPWAYPEGMFSLDQAQHMLTIGERRWNTVTWAKDEAWEDAIDKAIRKMRAKGVRGKIERPKGRKVRVITPHIQPITRMAPGGDLTGGDTPKLLSASELLFALPLLNSGGNHPLTDPEDIDAKRKQGYLLGRHLGLGSTSVAAANRTRRRPKALTVRVRRP